MILFLTALLASAAPDASAAPVVRVAEGSLRGVREADGRMLFRGIPFAAPPTGPRRWRPPVAATPWRGIRDARASAPSCLQLDEGWNRANATGSREDCLYLEVGTANLSPARPQPVMVWIHGGSNRAGGAQGTVGSSLVTRGIVLVSIQYRLGPLGFMAHPALTAEGATRASGNYGLMDQQAALRWVRRNIARFGGDPANVTIFGGSAGGQDVGLQQVSPGARGLFDKAIEQSGTPGFGWAPRDLRTSEAIGQEIADKAGLSHATADALRAISADRLLQASREIPTPPGLPDAGTVWLQTTIDGKVITEPPSRTLQRGGGLAVPLLIGSNAREIDFFHDPAAARRGLVEALGSDAPALPDGDTRLATAEGRLALATDLVFTCPATLVADARQRAGIAVWRYDFGYSPPGGPAVTHSSELRYIFHRPGEDGVPADAPDLQGYWIRFARTGNPNGAGASVWPKWDGRGAGLSFTDRGTAPTIPMPAVCTHARYP
ncbi:carboxylesterase/lipase family protein [Sphingomonas sp. Leaf21]|uniref:carboxylesterase/lipase family protein n=1 Tax=Sphingomonas sp. Leaf21 TaxID=2876550 RepID=UPI001E4259E4|nr:carboxylesterase family protein [Sphingomonas sp. Leaf21]